MVVHMVCILQCQCCFMALSRDEKKHPTAYINEPLSADNFTCRTSDSMLPVMQDDEEEDEEEQPEDPILALPAPGDDNQGGHIEADMHAAIASSELANYAKVMQLLKLKLEAAVN